MPEYHLDVHDDYRTWSSLDDFTQGYIEALFFTEHSPAFSYGDIEDDKAEWERALSEGQSDGQIPGDATFADLAPDALRKCVEDCRAFQEANQDLLNRAYEHLGYGSESAGRDFWYTRNGHGVGFWDRGLGDLGKKLSAACGWRTRFGEVYVYLGDDNKVHI